MDLARLIVDRAEEMQHADRSRDYFVFRITYQCFEPLPPPFASVDGFTTRFARLDLPYDFEVHAAPLVSGSERLTVRHTGMRWTLDAQSPMVRRIFDMWLAQTLRNVMRTLGVDELDDLDVTLRVFHGPPEECAGPAFEDEMRIAALDRLYRYQASQTEFNEEGKSHGENGGYDELLGFKEWCWSFVDVCARHEFAR